MSHLEDAEAFMGKAKEAKEAKEALASKVEGINLCDDGSNAGAGEASDNPTGVQPQGPPKDAEEAVGRARQHHFPERVPYNYTSEESAPWAGSAAVYEFKDEYGDVPPRDTLLEEDLFKNAFMMQQGEHMQALNFDVHFEGPINVLPIQDFKNAGVHPVMLENIELCGYKHPTAIQSYCLPAVLTGHDVLAVAQTGSGKTGAYLIPVLSQLMGKYKKIAAPRPGLNSCTLEFIFDQTRRLAYRTMLRPCVIYGGGPAAEQRKQLMLGCDILIATPGRLKDFLRSGNLLSLRRVKYTILDEADELLQPDWETDLDKFMTGADANDDADHVYMMFSATFSKEARQVARQYMGTDYLRIRVGRVGSTHRNVTQNVLWVEENLKREALYDLLFAVPPARTLVFVNSKSKAELIDDFLYNKGLPTTSIHGDRTQREREDALLAFRVGHAPILVTTGVAARGLEIKNVMHVINFDLPNGAHGGIDEYVHRIGRTARIGHEGLATSFYNSRNEDVASDLVKILIESKQEVPDFLTEYKPADGVELKFDDDTDKEEDGDDGGVSAPAAGNEGGTWDAPAVANTKDGGWDTPAQPDTAW